MGHLNWLIDLAWISSLQGCTPRTVCECAVGPMDISIAPGFSGRCDRLLLIEPLQMFADEARKIPGSEVHQVAIGPDSSKGLLLNNGGSSYLDGTWSPTLRDDLNSVPVDIVTFDTLDDGRIDIMNLDCEGQEWSVLSKMTSRPQLLIIEAWTSHPYFQEILSWIKANDYVPRVATGPTSETILYSHAYTKNPR